jgi:uncharacterized protein with HEPN domain
MLPKKAKERISHILLAIQEIQEFTQGMDFESFNKDEKTIRAVEMNFIIIGEAANAISDQVEDLYPHIPWHLMRAMRNRIAHVYFSVDNALLWDTIQNDLPPLIPELEKLI